MHIYSGGIGMIKSVAGVYFSPSGEAAKITKKISKVIRDCVESISVEEIRCEYEDMLVKSSEHVNGMEFDPETVVVIGVPAVSGRLPSPCVDMLKKNRGNGAFAIILVTYGNNTYGDALFEMYTLMEEAGFNVASAAAFARGNAIFGKSRGRKPDREDIEKIIEFAKISANKIRRFTGTAIEEMRIKPAPLNIKGSMPTRRPLRIPLHPSANSLCINCGHCIEICPVGAIDKSDPSNIDIKKCIACTACVSACEQDARGFSGPMYAASKIAHEIFTKKKREPEWFI